VHLAESPAEHAKLASAIEAARKRRMAAPPTATPACTTIQCTAEYVSQATAEIDSLLMGCLGVRSMTGFIGNFPDGTPIRKDEPVLVTEGGEPIDGRIAVRVRIESEPGVGAIVTSSDINEDRTTIADPQVRECVRETMYAIELDPARIGTVLTFEIAVSASEKSRESDEQLRAAEKELQKLAAEQQEQCSPAM
jgi:hypothetical protein